MKAWFVWCGDDWGDYVHGDTPAKAKSMFWRSWSGECEWIDLRPIRCPRLDNIPITDKSIRELFDAKSAEYDDKYDWIPICKCKICDGAQE